MKGTFLIRNDLTAVVVDREERMATTDPYFTFVGTNFCSKATPLSKEEAEQLLHDYGTGELKNCTIVTFE